jgi:hypothetical protein
MTVLSVVAARLPSALAIAKVRAFMDFTAARLKVGFARMGLA